VSSLHQSFLYFLLPAVTEVHDEDEFSASTLADLLVEALFIFALHCQMTIAHFVLVMALKKKR
jgi:hypothetical protein